ncbi:hypothetical protein FGG90_02810 [Clavibacter tessellarius]|nr:immunity 22 family protein [Clavibacter michiganensis]UKF33014.1 hypothetical protein FGG90_02810 [Clavibacter michiganensis subsp. tessellarius]
MRSEEEDRPAWEEMIVGPDPQLVSVWAGHFDSEEQFFSHVEMQYEGDSVSSAFISRSGVPWYDEDFAEGIYLEGCRDVRAALCGLSWGASFAHALVSAIDLHGFNAVYVVYDLEGSPGAGTADAPLTYIGACEYSKSASPT